MPRLIASFTVGLWACAQFGAAAAAVPGEPLEIGTDPQYVFDRYVIDSHWAVKYKREAVERVFHQPRKYEGNPLIAGDGGFGTAIRDPESGTFRLWYQTWTPPETKGRSGRYAVAYAESQDGLRWRRPKFGRYEWNGTKENNIVWLGLNRRRASSPFLLNLPDKQRRGFRHVMLYRSTDGSHLIGSQDGLHWDEESDTHISRVHSDTANTILFDPRRDEFVMYCRAKHIYRRFRGDVIDTGASRRVARMASPELWTTWSDRPQTILVPDELDARERFHFFYGMPTDFHGGLYWGLLWPFKMNSDIDTELAFSRDGVHFDRLPWRPKLIERGPDGAWDDGMAFALHRFLEVGDEWWIYYAGWDGPHGTRERTPGIGLAKVRKEGLISLRGPRGGGVACTRPVRWPGGELLVNADARGGELKVRISDERRDVLPGYDYDDCVPITGDGTAQRIEWKGKSLDALRGKTVRIEFYLRDAGLYTFRASGPK